MPKSPTQQSQSHPPRYWAPKYWPTWLAIGLLNLWAMLPWRWQCTIARVLGNLAYYCARRRRHIVEVNLKLCFPLWSATERSRRVKDVLYNNMLGLVETARVYRKGGAAGIPYHFELKGTEILDSALEQDRGVLLLGAHFSHLDLGGAIVASRYRPYAIYRPNNNPLFDRYIYNGRSGFMPGVIERNDMRAIVRTLKQKQIVWYPPDQDYGRSHSVFAPLFGVNAATITATSRLVKFNQSPVVVMSCVRDDERQCYTVEFYPAPHGFPSGDDVQDATLINQALEHSIGRAPTQYMWTHRRFKTQPDGRAKLYK